MSTIQVDEADTPELKTWLMKRLEDISDADTDVLADYVIALVKSDEPEETIRSNCVENLEDFLHDHSQGFVTDVFQAIRSKSFKPGYKPPPSKPAGLPGLNASAPSFQPPTASPASQGPPTGPAGQAQASFGLPQQLLNTQAALSKKRSFNESNAGGQGAPQGPGGERAIKQMKRGGPDARERGGGRGRGKAGFQQQQQAQTQMPQPPQGFPQFDPNNPMASLMAMQAMGFPMPGLDQMSGMQQSQQQQGRKKGRCRDYDNKGFCARGSTCHYEHGSDHIVVPEAYDPANASMGFPPPNQQAPAQPFATPPTRGSNHPRARGAGRGDLQVRGRGTQARSSISALGPSTNPSNTSIVIEQIPAEKFNNDSVTAFFSEFGTITKIDLQEYKRLAVIKFEDHDSAQRAYESPKVIFDNRFVKVYWYKPEREDQLQSSTRASIEGRAPSRSRSQRASSSQAGDTAMGGTGGAEEPQLSPEEFAKKQEEAQKAHDEKMRKVKEAEEAKNELDRKIKAQAEERRKLLERLEAKSKLGAGSPAPGAKGATPGPQNGEADKESDAKAEQTEALRSKLAALEAEAKAMGIPSDESPHQSGYAPFSRGGYGGYGGGFRGRGRGAYGAYAPRGRGGYGGWTGGSVARLDNRPKTVAVKALESGKDLGSQEADESLRAFLYGIGAFSSITKPDSNDTSTVHVAFNERYIAEMFMNAGSSPLPGIGKVEMSWVANQPPPSTTTNGHATNGAEQKMAGVDTEMGNGNATGQAKAEEVDYDVADEMDEYR